MADQSPQNPEATTSAPVTEPLLLSWSTHPAKARPLVTTLVILFLIVLAVLVYLLTYSAIFTVIAALILYGSLTQYFTKTTYEFTDIKVRVKYVVNKIEKDWAQYRSYYVDKNGVLLSPFAGPSRLENFRGLFIRFASNKDQVMEVVRQKINYVPDKD
ncbi:MAG: hypothetical protein NT028_12940 [candidate division Zixibacteria bacterium]|nr:hypothetical protein [candidate division Zixibacteria bacterium]